MKKKLFALLLTLLLCVSFAGCTGSEAQVSVPETTAVPTVETTAAPTTEPTTEPTTVPTEPPEYWRENQLMENNPWANPVYNSKIFGSSYDQTQITAATFLDTVADAPEDAWDVSMEQNGSVLAWVDTTDGYHIYIAGEGGVMAPGDCGWLFGGWRKLKEINFNGNLHTDDVWNFDGMFFDCDSLTSLDVSTLNTSNGTLFGGMFGGCDSLVELNMTGLDTSKAESIADMFAYCAFEELDLTHFDTSNVTNMSGMFNRCKNLKSVDLSSFDTSKVTSMAFLFNECRALPSADVSHFDTSKVTDMEKVFAETKSLESLDLSTWDTSSVTHMPWMFQGSNLKDLTAGEWETDSIVRRSDFAPYSMTANGEPWQNLFAK